MGEGAFGVGGDAEGRGGVVGLLSFKPQVPNSKLKNLAVSSSLPRLVSPRLVFSITQTSRQFSLSISAAA